MALVARRVLDTWTAWYDSRIDKWIRILHLSKIAVAFCAMLSAVSLAGLMLALRKDLVAALPVALCTAVFPIPYYVTHTTLRYRHPIDPLLLLFAVCLAYRLVTWFTRDSRYGSMASQSS
jgi:hypothetical protein